MRGDLSETSAADACRDLAGDGATGVLWIDGPDGPGSVTFVEGRVVGATSPTPRARLGDRLVGAGFLEDEALADALDTQRGSGGRSRLGALLVERTQVPRDAIRLFVQEQTLDAMFEVLRWRFGSFSFESGEATVVPEIPVALTVDQALVEVARRQQQWRELSEVIPDLEAVPTFRSDPASAIASLEPDEFAVLASVDGDRSVRALAADLGYGEFELARIVYGLVLLGVVKIELPEDEIGAALDDAMGYPGHAETARERPARALAAVPDPEPDPRPAVEEPAAAEGSIMESELPERSYSDVFRELRGLEESPPPSPGSIPARGSTVDRTPVADQPPSTEVPATEASATESPPADTPDGGAEPSSRRSPEDGDVSEFLRELSRLALDDKPEEPKRPRRSPPPAPSDPKDDDSKRKRRGLFGRG